MSSPSLDSLAIVGPGRVGRALGRRWVEAGLGVGFVGRSPSSAAEAVDFAGGRILNREDLAAAAVVVLAVQDDCLEEAVAGLAGLATSGVWLHCSGAHDLAVLAPLAQAGVRTASLHPVCPIPDPEVGFRNLPESPGVIQVQAGDTETAALVSDLARSADLDPVVVDGGDRLLYHTACVLGANGLTALVSVVGELLNETMPAASAETVGSALLTGALSASREHGALAALSGPVTRGDSGLVGRQLSALAEVDPEVAGMFRALMQRAATMSARRGTLVDEALVEMRGVLEGHG